MGAIDGGLCSALDVWWLINDDNDNDEFDCTSCIPKIHQSSNEENSVSNNKNKSKIHTWATEAHPYNQIEKEH